MYSKNDYRYYLEDELMHSDDFLAHYGIKGMRWKNKKKRISEDIQNTSVNPSKNVIADQERGKKRSITTKNNLKSITSYKDKKTTRDPNLSTTREKGHYSNRLFNRTHMYSPLRSRGVEKETTEYGQLQKLKDKHGDKKEHRQAINKKYKYKYDRSKSVKENAKQYKINKKLKKRDRKTWNKRIKEQYSDNVRG